MWARDSLGRMKMSQFPKTELMEFLKINFFVLDVIYVYKGRWLRVWDECVCVGGGGVECCVKREGWHPSGRLTHCGITDHPAVAGSDIFSSTVLSTDRAEIHILKPCFEVFS
jgi:hypothetical protein